MKWFHWSCGFAAGAVLATYLTLSCTPTRAQSAEVVEALQQASWTHGVSYEWLRATAWCESKYVPRARGRAGEMGLMQFKWTTWVWMSRQAGYAGASPDDPYAAAQVAAWAFAHRLSSHWSCA